MKPSVMQEEKCKTQDGMTMLNSQRMNPPSVWTIFEDIWTRKVKGIISDSHISNSTCAERNCNSYGNWGRPCFEEKITMQIPENSCYLNNVPRVIHVDGVLLHGVL